MHCMIRFDVYLLLDVSFSDTLRRSFNKIHITGIVVENLKWMYESAKQFEDSQFSMDFSFLMKWAYKQIFKLLRKENPGN